MTNLYRIDDVLLRAGLIPGVIAVLAVSVIVGNLGASGLGLSTGVALAMWIACPVTLLAIGWNIRRREKLLVTMWRLIEAQGQVPIRQVAQMTSFGPRQIAAAVERINSRGNAVLTLDKHAGVIRDDSVQRHSLTHSEDCQSCGGRVNIEVSTRQTDYLCPYCGTGLDSTRINPLLGKLQVREGKQPIPDAPLPPVAAPTAKKMNLALFIVLLMVFWPAAVFYAIKANSASF